MKLITPDIPVFQPVNLLIESEAEIKLLANLVAACTGDASKVACGSGDAAYDIYTVIKQYADRDISTKIEICTTN